MALACLCLRSSQFLPNNPACPRDYPSVCALCGGGHVLVTATLFALSRMRVIRVTNKLRLYNPRFGNVRGKKKCAKNVASYSETRQDWNLNEGASSACYVESIWLHDDGSFSHYEAALCLSDQTSAQQLVTQSIYPSVLVNSSPPLATCSVIL